jgi:hypothetical protein
MKTLAISFLMLVVLSASAARGQERPADYQDVLRQLDRKGDFKANVLRISIPRNDLMVVVDGVATPTSIGFGGWLSMTKGDGGVDVMVGDLVVTEDEVQPVLKSLRAHGIEAVAIHRHLNGSKPAIIFLHYWGKGPAERLARAFRAALDLTPAK